MRLPTDSELDLQRKKNKIIECASKRRRGRLLSSDAVLLFYLVSDVGSSCSRQNDLKKYLKRAIFISSGQRLICKGCCGASYNWVTWVKVWFVPVGRLLSLFAGIDDHLLCPLHRQNSWLKVLRNCRLIVQYRIKFIAELTIAKMSIKSPATHKYVDFFIKSNDLSVLCYNTSYHDYTPCDYTTPTV